MKSARTLARRELAMMFHAPATYVIFVVFLLLTGWLFVSKLFQFGQSTLDTFVRPLPLIFTFLMPALTMRLFAEEVRSGTIESLSTLPIRDYQIVLGKYLAAIGLLGSLMAFTLPYVVLLCVIGRPDPGQLFGSYLAVLGLGSFFAAIGLWASSLVRRQEVAFIIGFFVCFVFFLINLAADALPPGVAGYVRALGVDAHFDSMIRGVIDSRDLLYWAGGTTFFLSAALSVLHSKRWR